MRRAISKYASNFAAVIALAAIAIGVAAYILPQQRFRFPFIDATPFKLKAAFSTAQAVTPGQGQTVRISGVRIGDISGVSLQNGEAIVALDVDPQYKDLIHTNASALLRPKTGLKDMFIELNPGNSKAPKVTENWTIPVSNTLPDINPDEIFAALDETGRDYLKLLVQGAGGGLHHAGNQLRDVLARFLPTNRDLARVNAFVVRRHANLSHVVHSLNVLNAELSTRGPQIASLVKSSNTVFGAIGSEQANLQQALRLLPGTLQQTTTTLGKVQSLAGVLKPTATALQPVALSLNKANAAVAPFLRTTTPILRDQIRPFTRSAQPLVASLVAPARSLASASPDLTSSFVVLNHLFNMLGYNPYGNTPFSPAINGNYLFWLAWLGHNGDAVFSTVDANGPLRALTQTSTCATLKGLVAQTPAALAALNLAGVLSNPALCGP
ncbi:MAG: MlaD family protein [Solirubrobacteraceae bacterium]